MDWFSLIALAVALAMDAFAVAVVTGITLPELTKRRIFRLSFHFGLFQALMPVLGWVAGKAVHRYLSAVDHWVAFGLLAVVGAKMISEAWGDEHEASAVNDPTSGWPLVALSVATSIDALAVGLSLALVGTAIAFPALVIGVVAAGFTATGMVLGRQIGAHWSKRVEILGGSILIAIGAKILIDHLLGG
jgi:manganese efflux pump family protein